MNFDEFSASVTAVLVFIVIMVGGLFCIVGLYYYIRQRAWKLALASLAGLLFCVFCFCAEFVFKSPNG